MSFCETVCGIHGQREEEQKISLSDYCISSASEIFKFQEMFTLRRIGHFFMLKQDVTVISLVLRNMHENCSTACNKNC